MAAPAHARTWPTSRNPCNRLLSHHLCCHRIAVTEATHGPHCILWPNGPWQSRPPCPSACSSHQLSTQIYSPTAIPPTSSHLALDAGAWHWPGWLAGTSHCSSLAQSSLHLGPHDPACPGWPRPHAPDHRSSPSLPFGHPCPVCCWTTSDDPGRASLGRARVSESSWPGPSQSIGGWPQHPASSTSLPFTPIGYCSPAVSPAGNCTLADSTSAGRGRWVRRYHLSLPLPGHACLVHGPRPSFASQRCIALGPGHSSPAPSCAWHCSLRLSGPSPWGSLSPAPRASGTGPRQAKHNKLRDRWASLLRSAGWHVQLEQLVNTTAGPHRADLTTIPPAGLASADPKYGSPELLVRESSSVVSIFTPRRALTDHVWGRRRRSFLTTQRRIWVSGRWGMIFRAPCLDARSRTKSAGFSDGPGPWLPCDGPGLALWPYWSTAPSGLPCQGCTTPNGLLPGDVRLFLSPMLSPFLSCMWVASASSAGCCANWLSAPWLPLLQPGGLTSPWSLGVRLLLSVILWPWAPSGSTLLALVLASCRPP